ncbi:MAG: zf-HC2 domain-containing protein [Polyangiaceae bacterium]|nr:zf-HC2 domain-containing protein [Polyangiaceae bacterium]
MDCEKFDQVVMDALYGELDELTAAALRRHVDSCVRCSEAWNGLRSTREGASLPLDEPSPDLESRIMAAALAAQRKTPWHRQVLRVLAWAGSHAMRPQLAMAALFFLVIGSSLLLLRAKPGTVGTSPVSVTERGVPTPDEPEAPTPQAIAAAPAPPAAAAEAAEVDSDKRGKDGQEKQAQSSDGEAAKALSQARSTRDQSGCGAAVPLYEDIGTRFSGTSAAADAAWEAAQCQKSLGNNEKARELLSSLKSSEGYRQRAEDALRETETGTSTGAAAAAPGGGVAGGAVASRAAAAPAPAAKPADPPVGATAKSKASAPGGGPTRSVPASPKRNADLNSAYGY